MTTALLLVLPTAVLLVVKRGRLDHWFLVTLPLGQWVAGSMASDVAGSDIVAATVGVAMVGFVVLALPEYEASRAVAPDPALGWHRLRVPMTVLVLALTTLHFARAGIPLFSPSVETDRFDLAASGFMGIPSRTFLYVLPATAIWGAVAVGRIRLDPCVVGLWAALVLSRLAGGMKSGLLEVGIYAFVVALRRHGPLNVKEFLRGRSLLAAATILFGAAVIAQTYGTVQQRQDGSVADYLAERLTVGTIGASAHAVSDMTFEEPPVLRDAEHYIRKYAGVGQAGHSTGRLVVASYYGRPVTEGAAEASVTLGLPVELRLSGGLPLVLIGTAGTALLLRWLRRRMMTSTSFGVGLYGLAIVVVARIVGNGGVAFYTVNLVGSVVLFVVFLGISSVASEGASRQVPRQRSFAGP